MQRNVTIIYFLLGSSGNLVLFTFFYGYLTGLSQSYSLSGEYHVGRNGSSKATSNRRVLNKGLSPNPNNVAVGAA